MFSQTLNMKDIPIVMDLMENLFIYGKSIHCKPLNPEESIWQGYIVKVGGLVADSQKGKGAAETYSFQSDDGHSLET